MGFSVLNVIGNSLFNKLTNPEKLLFSVLQGLANRGDSGIYCTPNDFVPNTAPPLAAELWLEQIDVKQETVSDPWSLLDTYPQINKYILYDPKNQDTINIATSLAGLAMALPVDESLEQRLIEKNYTKYEDVSSWNMTDFLNDYLTEFYTGFAVELTCDEFWGPRDLAVAYKAVVIFDTEQRDMVLPHLKGSAAILGWGRPAPTEYAFILDASIHGDYFVAADHAHNLSAFIRLDVEPIPVPLPSPTAGADPECKQTKYVAFMISDGDNVQWLLNRGNCVNWWGNPLRGQIPLGWTFAPSLYQAAPTVWNYYISTLKDTDEVICGASGIGFVFDAIADSDKFPEFLAQTEQFVKSARVPLVATFGNDPYPNPTYLQGFTKMEAVSGVIYSSFQPWVVPSDPRVVTYGDKAVIPTSLLLDGNHLPQTVVDKILKGSTQPPLYLVYVDAWGNANNPLEYVKQVCDLLQSHSEIHIVKPSELFARVPVEVG